MDLQIHVPFSHLVAKAQALGSQDQDLCPPHTTQCWLSTNKAPYTTNPATVDTECTECWLYWLTKGEK